MEFKKIILTLVLLFSLLLVSFLIVTAFISCNKNKDLSEFAKQQNDLLRIAATEQLTGFCEADGVKLVYTFTFGKNISKEDMDSIIYSRKSYYNEIFQSANRTGYYCRAVDVYYRENNGNGYLNWLLRD